MQPTYYTPELKEFHVGFEYERLYVLYWQYKEQHKESPSSHLPLIKVESKSERLAGKYKTTEWVKETFDEYSSINFLSDEIAAGRIRVKHLNREDIESLGWVFNIEGSDEFVCGKYHLIFQGHNKSVTIYKSNTVFCGTIKNKSELSFLMERLGIKTEKA